MKRFALTGLLISVAIAVCGGLLSVLFGAAPRRSVPAPSPVKIAAKPLRRRSSPPNASSAANKPFPGILFAEMPMYRGDKRFTLAACRFSRSQNAIIGIVYSDAKIEEPNARITFAIFGADGNETGTATASIASLAPGAGWDFSAPVNGDFAKWKFAEFQVNGQ